MNNKPEKLSCVTTYTNPDTDGICSELAYRYYMHAKGEDIIPVYFGELDKETTFILNYFNFPFPQKVENTNAFNKITIVDTHHVTQLSKSISLENVIEIIDHHPGGNPECFPNAKIQNDEIGAACTIIVERMQDDNIIPDGAMAGLMSMAIISNTLNFTAPSTSKRDKEAVRWLEQFISIDSNLITQMFDARSDFSEISSYDILNKNLKEFNWGKVKIGISQVEIIDVNTIIERSDFLDSMATIKKNLSLDFIIFSGVNLLKYTTTIVCPNSETVKIVTDGMGLKSDANIFVVNRILLRKTDFIPQLKSYFEK